MPDHLCLLGASAERSAARAPAALPREQRTRPPLPGPTADRTGLSPAKVFRSRAAAPQARRCAGLRQHSPDRGSGAHQQSTPIRPTAALRPRRQGPSAPNGGSTGSAGAIDSGAAPAPPPERGPDRAQPHLHPARAGRRGKRPHFRPHFLHTPRNSRERSAARVRVTGAT